VHGLTIHLAFQFLAVASLIGLVVWVWRERPRQDAADTIIGPSGTYLLRRPDQRVFGILIASLFFFVGLGLAMDPNRVWTYREAIFGLVVFSLVIVSGITTATTSRRVAARMDRDGIERLGLFKRSRIHWKEITSVSYSEWLGRRLIFRTADGRKLNISLEYEGSNGLLFLLEDVLPAATVDQRVRNIFPGQR
jgi:hypothetical protein